LYFCSELWTASEQFDKKKQTLKFRETVRCVEMQRIAVAKAELVAAAGCVDGALLRLVAAKAEEVSAMEAAVDARVELVAAMEVVVSWNAGDAPMKELAFAKAELLVAVKSAAAARVALDAYIVPNVEVALGARTTNNIEEFGLDRA
jgi:hypothetical protein